MKILIASIHQPNRSSRADAVIVWELLQILGRDNSCSSIYFSQTGQEVYWANANREIIKTITCQSRQTHLQNISDSITKPFPRSYYLYDWNSFTELMHEIISQEKVDLLILIHPYFVAMGARLHEIEIPVFFFMYDSIVLKLNRNIQLKKIGPKRIFNLIQLTKWKKAYRQHLTKFPLISVVSEVEKESLISIQKEFSNRTHIIPIGTNTDYFAPQTLPPGLGEETPTLIFTGDMSGLQSVDAIRFFSHQVWPILRNKKSDIKWLIVGRNPHSDIVSMADNDPNIFVTGEVDDFRPFFAKSHVYVCPIRGGGGMKNRLLEALSMGMPSVVTSVASNGLDVIDGIHLFITDNPGTFAEKILHLLEDDKVREMLSRNARKKIFQDYSWDAVGQKVFALSKKVIYKNGQDK